MEEKSLDFSSLLDVVNLLSKKKIEKTNFVFTTIGVVKNCKDPEAGAYLIQADNTSYIAYSLDPSIIYELDTPVYILKTNKDDLDKKFILGSTSLINEDLNNRNNYLTKINDPSSAAFINAVRQYGKIMLEINTPRLSSENKIKITLKNSSQILTFDMSDITVDNDSLVGTINQKKLFYIENYENFNGFNNIENTTGLELIFYPVISDLLDDYSIKTFEKNNLNYIDDEDDIITLSFNSFIDNVKFIMSDYRCYWLKKDAPLRGYQYEKEGWGCVNERQTLDQYIGYETTAPEGKKDIFVSSPILTITKNDNLQADNIYKCIIVYNNRIIESDEFHIYYLDESSFSATLDITSENNIVSKEKTVELKVTIETNALATFDYIYGWYLDDIKLKVDNVETCELNATQVLKNESNCYCIITIEKDKDEIAKIKSNNIVIYREITDGKNGANGKDGINGKDGRAVVSSQEQYCIALNDSQDPFEGTSIYEDMDSAVEAYLKLDQSTKDKNSIWTRTKTEYSGGDPNFSYSTPSKQNATAAVAKWCMAENITVINGASIATGTITAGQIKTESLTAGRILVQDAENNIIFKASNGKYFDVNSKQEMEESKEVEIAGFFVDANKLYIPLLKGDPEVNIAKPDIWSIRGYNSGWDIKNSIFKISNHLDSGETIDGSQYYAPELTIGTVISYSNQEIEAPFISTGMIKIPTEMGNSYKDARPYVYKIGKENSPMEILINQSLYIENHTSIRPRTFLTERFKASQASQFINIGEENRPFNKIYATEYNFSKLGDNNILRTISLDYEGISTLQTNVSALKTNVPILQTDVSALKTDVSALENNVDILENNEKIKTWKQKFLDSGTSTNEALTYTKTIEGLGTVTVMPGKTAARKKHYYYDVQYNLKTSLSFDKVLGAQVTPIYSHKLTGSSDAALEGSTNVLYGMGAHVSEDSDGYAIITVTIDCPDPSSLDGEENGFYCMITYKN